MRDSEIKTLFAKADEQVHVDEIRKQKTYYAMIEEMEKQRTPMMALSRILPMMNPPKTALASWQTLKKRLAASMGISAYTIFFICRSSIFLLSSIYTEEMTAVMPVNRPLPMAML